MKEVIENISKLIETATRSYNRLLLIVGKPGCGKSAFLNEIAAEFNFPLINLNISFSEKLLLLNERQRKIQGFNLLQQVINGSDSNALILDNIELLFDISLAIDPLRVLENISRNTLIIASWPGNISENRLIYAEASHQEYRAYNANEILFFNLNM